MSRREPTSAAVVIPTAISGAGLRHGLGRAVGRLAQQRDRINDLNVFPVPDGDTGTNMHLTLEAALAEASQLPADAPSGRFRKWPPTVR